MKVKELIEELKKYDENLNVFISHTEESSKDMDISKLIKDNFGSGFEEIGIFTDKVW